VYAVVTAFQQRKITLVNDFFIGVGEATLPFAQDRRAQIAARH